MFSSIMSALSVLVPSCMIFLSHCLSKSCMIFRTLGVTFKGNMLSAVKRKWAFSFVVRPF